MSQATQTAQPRTQEQSQPGRTLAEWVTFGIATLILLAIIGLVIYDGIATPPTPPVFSLRQNGEIREQDGQFYVHFTVENSGGETAQAVQIIAELRLNGEVVEAGEQQIDFLSGAETEAGAFVFTKNPREGELSMRVASYILP